MPRGASPARGGQGSIQLSLEGEGLAALQRKMKALDDALRKDLVKELNKELRTAAARMIPDARDAARTELPKAGGLAERVAGLKMLAQVKSGRYAGVQIKVRGHEAGPSNRGTLRHPVYGNRDVWVLQKIKPGWFTDRMRREAPKVRPDLIRAMDRIAEKIARA